MEVSDGGGGGGRKREGKKESNSTFSTFEAHPNQVCDNTYSKRRLYKYMHSHRFDSFLSTSDDDDANDNVFFDPVQRA